MAKPMSKPGRSQRRTTSINFIFGAVMASVIAACTTSGTATGQLVTAAGKRQSVTFVWHSDGADWRRGTISVTLPSGESYRGSYHQVSRGYPAYAYSPMWVGWEPFWPDWPAPWYVGRAYGPGWTGWITVYEGKVVARLASAQDAGRYMRCRFTLEDPSTSMSGGGAGDCQLSDGSAIRDAVLAAE